MPQYVDCNRKSAKERKNTCLMDRLQDARSKLAPIIENILLDEDGSPSNCALSGDQYQDVIWAYQSLQEADYQHKMYELGNSNVIVNHFTVDENGTPRMSVKDSSVVIDRQTLADLVELYEQMGVIIQRMKTESLRKNENAINASPQETKQSIISQNTQKSESDLSPFESTSTLSNLLNSSSSNLRQHSSLKDSFSRTPKQSMQKTNDDKEGSGEGTVYIKIQCFTDCSDEDLKTSDLEDCQCAKSCASQYHIKVGGQPVTLKMNQNNIEDGQVYCINTNDDDETDIKIIIKQCPACRATVIASSSKISGAIKGESHESITLHGKTGDETKMTYSSDESESEDTGPCQCPSEDDEPCRCLSKSSVLIDISSHCLCKKGDDSKNGQRKMSVFIDSDSVDKSTVKMPDGPKPSLDDRTEITRSKIPLRRQICSSMEFDVATVATRLRDEPIENQNAHIVVELKKLGVDKVLRACRPAKCCRKAILNERQRTALPYCVSLKSLPLVQRDIEIVKQSIAMSLKNEKKGSDLGQKNKLAYYVSLGKDDFKPKDNFSWVAPVYDVQFGHRTRKIKTSFVLKKVSSAKIEEFSKSRPFYVLKKPNRTVNRWQLRRIKRKLLDKKEEKSYFVDHTKQKTQVSTNFRCEDWRYFCERKQKCLAFNSDELYLGHRNTYTQSFYDDFVDILSLTNLVFPKRKGKRHKNTNSTFLENLLAKEKALDNYMEQLDTKRRLQKFFSVRSVYTSTTSLSAVWSDKQKSFQKASAKKRTLDKFWNPFSNSSSLVHLDNRSNKKDRKKLKFYIDLVNGDLVWKSVPFDLSNYKLYYNYSNETNGTPKKDSIVASRITHVQNTGLESCTAKINQLSVETHLKQIPEEFAFVPMEPEQQNGLWAPLSTSDSSLPDPKREIIVLKDVSRLEAKPKLEKNKPSGQEFFSTKNKSSKGCNTTGCKQKCYIRNIRISIKKMKRSADGNPMV